MNSIKKIFALFLSCQMIVSFGNIINIEATESFEDFDSINIEETINNNKCYTVLAIHTCGEDGNDNDNSENNSGTRITTDIMKFYMSNSNIGY